MTEEAVYRMDGGKSIVNSFEYWYC